jgi:hypothetical protein
MDQDPMYERSFDLPMGYVFTARVTPSTIRGTALRLLPWAIYAMLPQGRGSRLALAAARRLSPLVKYSIKS